MSTQNHTVFISYATENRDVADAVFHHLSQRGLDVWMAPKSMSRMGGRPWPEVLVEVIKSCKALVLIFSKHANDSNPVLAEVTLAFKWNKHILPMRIEDEMPTGSMEFYTSCPHWLDALGSLSEEHLEMLTQSIESLVGVEEKIEARRTRTPEQDRLSRKVEPPVAPVVPPVERPATIAQPALRLCPSLDSFDAQARRVVMTALALATRCRAPAISNRLLLAAFISDAAGFAARACHTMGVQPQLLWALLVAMSHEGTDTDKGEEFAKVKLTPESGGRILFPTMRRAAALASNPKAITAQEFFRAFCETADPAFVQLLRALSDDDTFETLEVDLAEMPASDPETPGMLDGLTLRARGVVRMAYQLARKRQVSPIPNRLMLAAFLANPNGVAARAMAEGRNPPAKLSDVLVKAAHANTKDDFEMTDAVCARIVTPTIERARELAASGDPVTEALLFRAFCEKAEPMMKTELKKLGVDLDAFARGESINVSLPPQIKPSVPTPPSMPGGGWGLN